MLLHPARARALGEAGRRAVFERFSAQAMARAMAQIVVPASRKIVPLAGINFKAAAAIRPLAVRARVARSLNEAKVEL